MLAEHLEIQYAVLGLHVEHIRCQYAACGIQSPVSGIRYVAVRVRARPILGFSSPVLFYDTIVNSPGARLLNTIQYPMSALTHSGTSRTCRLGSTGIGFRV